MRTTIENSITQVCETEVGAAPEAIWDAITLSEWTQRYGYGGNVEYDLRPGGAYRAFATKEMMGLGMPEVIVEGEVIEAERPHRLVQTWHPLFDAALAAEPATRVSWEIEPGANGATNVRITHELEGAPGTAAIVSGTVPEAGGGWPYILRDLKSLLETGTSLEG